MEKWVVGVSGGCDSMMLLDQCVNKKMELIVAHVNYQKRDTADRDMKIVQEYCQKHSIICHIAYADSHVKGNFQAYARDFRYAFFKQLAQQYNCKGVLIAHHLDDLLETYLIQKERNVVPLTYGLNNEVVVDGLLIRRPLLDVCKQDCYDYCHRFKIAYGDDESNFTNDYQRNRIRHELIEKMDHEMKMQMLTEIANLNRQKEENEGRIKNLLVPYEDELDVVWLKTFSHEEQVNLLRFWLMKQGAGVHFTGKFIENCIKCIYETKGNWSCDLSAAYMLYCDYGKLNVVQKDLAYCYMFDKIETFKCEYFQIGADGGKLFSATLRDEDFPITIRSPQNGDKIALRFGTKKLNRWFIDRKVSHKQRKSWPVVVNRMGNVILVPEIGCDIEHFTNKPNLFVLK